MTRRAALEIAVAGGVAATAGSSGQAASAPATGDWGFLVGRWKVRHRKLRERLAGSTD